MTVLVGNNVVNIATSSIVTVIVASMAPDGLAVVVTTIVASLLILVFGEIVPKAFGLGNAESWSLTVAPTIGTVEFLFSPLITLLETITVRMNSVLNADGEIEKPSLERSDVVLPSIRRRSILSTSAISSFEQIE